MAAQRSQPGRRVPRQERARATVEVILEAAARVLVAEGYERATTKRIAEVAGVSIGSLYQYFPNKASMVIELSRRNSARIMEALREASRAADDAPLPELAQHLVEAMIAAFRVNPALHKLLFEELPRIGELSQVAAAEQQVEALLRRRLARHRGELRPADLELAVFMLVRGVRSVIWAAVIERPEVLDTAAFVEELSALALAFLTR